MTTSQQRILLITLLAAAALASTLYWWQRGRPVFMPDAPEGRINCVSYAPYHHSGQTPFAEGTEISPGQIEHDLSQLAGRFNCVRTYSVGQGLTAVPPIARRLGMQVLLGIWLGRDRRANAREIALGIRTANSNRDTIRAVIVGNEVLLRGELPATELAADITRVRIATGLPVTYADVWEYWLKYPKLAADVSFVTIHILPYWEDHPVAIDDAVEHVQSVYDRLRARFPDKPVLIGETGWPSAGRQRGGAVPSRVNEARFMRSFLVYAAHSGISYNLVEAYNQPWKRWLEGTAGGYWGLYTTDGQQKFPWHGPVIEDPDWYFGPLAGIALALALCLSVFLRRVTPDRWHIVGLLLAGYTGGALIAAQCEHLWIASRDGFEWAITGSWTLFEFITVWMFACSFAQHLREPDARPVRKVYSLMALKWIRVRSQIRLHELLHFLWLFAAAIVCLLLIFDPRYRDFPIALFLPAAFWFCVFSLDDGADLSYSNLEMSILAGGLGIAAILIVSMEGVGNRSALAWTALCVLFCISVWMPYLRTRQYQRTHHQSDRAGFEAVPHQTGNADDGTQPGDPA